MFYPVRKLFFLFLLIVVALQVANVTNHFLHIFILKHPALRRHFPAPQSDRLHHSLIGCALGEKTFVAKVWNFLVAGLMTARTVAIVNLVPLDVIRRRERAIGLTTCQGQQESHANRRDPGVSCCEPFDKFLR